MSAKFPNEHYFLNSEANRKAFLQQFPDEVTLGSGVRMDDTMMKAYDGLFASKCGGRFLFRGDTACNFTEYVFTPPVPQFPTKPKVFPHGYYFLNTPENLAAFEREFPGMGWSTIGDHPTPALTIMLRCGEYAFAYHDVSLDGKTQYAFVTYSIKECETNGLIRHYFTHERDTASPVGRNLEVGEYITVAQGRLDDACREFSNVGEYCKGNEHPEDANPKSPVGFYNEGGKIIWDRTDPWFAQFMYGAKEVRWAGSAKLDAVDAMSEASSFVASPVPPKLTNCCFRNTRANVEEFMRQYPDVKSVLGRTPREMHTDHTYEWLAVDCGGTLCLSRDPCWPLLDLTPAASPSEFVPTPLTIVTDEQIAAWFQKCNTPPKPSRAKRILAYCLSPAKAWAQNITFLCAVSGIGYGGWKAYEWAKENAPTIKWEPKQEAGK